MKNSNLNNQTAARFLGFALTAALTALPAAASDRHRGDGVYGHVEVSKEIPGGVVTVGVGVGRPTPPTTVIVQQAPPVVRKEVVIVREQPRQPEVIIIKKHGRHGRHAREIRKVVYVRDHYGRRHREVVIERMVERPVCGNTVVYEVERDGHEGRHGHGRGHGEEQVSYVVQDATGNYVYYEDAQQVSIQDNRNGQNRQVYVRK